MADAMSALRPSIKSRETDPHRRAALFRALATSTALQILREKGVAAWKTGFFSNNL